MTSVTGIDESAGNSSEDGGTSRASSSAPSAATIAPLSVHSPGLGTRSRTRAASQRSAAGARSGELAATPPPITSWSTPLARHASTALRVSTSATASWNDAATSATGTASPAASRPSTQRATAVFSPENEKSKVLSRYLPRGERDGGRVAFRRRPVDRRAAGEQQPEQPGHLVVGLARRVVDRGPQRLQVARQVRPEQQPGEPARDEQGA